MKKTLISLAVITIFATPAVLADNVFGSLEYKFYDYSDIGAESNAYSTTVGFKPIDQLAVDFRSEFQDIQLDSSDEYASEKDFINQFEIGGTYSYPVTASVELFGRAALGHVSEADMNYFSIEPGVEFKFTDKVSGLVSYRYRDSIDEDYYDYRTDAARVGGKVQVTKNFSANLAWEGSYGDIESNAIIAGVGFEF